MNRRDFFRFWPFSDLVRCPLPRRCSGISRHRGFMSTRASKRNIPALQLLDYGLEKTEMATPARLAFNFPGRPIFTCEWGYPA
jgi:hypothetical protein